MEALDFIILGAGVWVAVITLAMTLLIAASRADEAAGESPGASRAGVPRERAVTMPRLGAMATPKRADGRRTAGLA